MSTTSKKQSRDEILEAFRNISGLNYEDCIQFLNQYNWQLEDIVQDFYNKKDFKKNSTQNSNEKKEFQQTPAQNSNPRNFSPQYTRPHQPVPNDDHYIAELLARYGDADESARRQWRETHRPQQMQQQPQQLSQENINTNSIIHEKQEYLRCGIHSLNNLFQMRDLFTHKHLDNIVREFDKRGVNNDYSTSWVGDYDLRILIEAITRYGHTVRQINFYSNEPLKNQPWDTYFGLLMNLDGAHWFTIKQINGIYYNLDSTFSRPSPLGQKDALVHYLIRLIERFKNVYIFAVL